MKTCIFCEISNYDYLNQVIKRYKSDVLCDVCDVVVFEPLNPCVEGHLLFVPDIHTESIGGTQFYTPDVVASTFKAVSMYLKENPTQCNVVTNNGADADQTVFHLHVHLIPRTKDDGVTLPWSHQKNKL